MALTNRERALQLASDLRLYRVSRGLSQRDVAGKSGISLTSLSRFEGTGAITLNNLIAVLGALGLADRLHDLVPADRSPSPIELLNASKASEPVQTRPRARRVTPKG